MVNQTSDQTGKNWLGWINRLLQLAPVMVALSFVAILAYVAVNRMAYPYDLEWMEGGIVSHVLRLLHGEPLFAAPSAEFAAYRYAPLYYFVGVLLGPLIGEGYFPLRLISFLSTIGTISLLIAFLRRETERWMPGFLAAGLFAATYGVSGFWFDLARTDAMFIFLTLSALLILRYDVSVRGVLLAALVSYLAFMTKQTALSILLVPGSMLLFYHRKLAVLYLCALTLLIVSNALILDDIYDGWYYYYVFKLGGGLISFPKDFQQTFGRFITATIWPQFWVVVVLTLMGAVWKSLIKVKSWASGFELAITISLIGSSLLVWANAGSYYNVLIPLHLALAIWFGKGYHTLQSILCRKKSVFRTTVLAALSILCLLQFKSLWYSPKDQIPPVSHRESNDALVDFLSKIEGDVFVPFHSYIPYQAGKKGAIDRQALWDIIRGTRDRNRWVLIDSMRVAIEERRYAAIVMDNLWYDQELLKANYYPADPPEFLKDTTAMATGWSTRPNQLWLPKSDTIQAEGESGAQ